MKIWEIVDHSASLAIEANNKIPEAMPRKGCGLGVRVASAACSIDELKKKRS